MGLFKSDKNLADQLADLTAANADLLARVEAAEATVGEKIDAVAALEKAQAEAADQAKAQADAAQADIAAKETALAEASAKIAELEAKLANPPAAYAHATEGSGKPIAEGGEGGAMSWAEAVKSCGGDYVAARKSHPDVWKAQFNFKK